MKINTTTTKVIDETLFNGNVAKKLANYEKIWFLFNIFMAKMNCLPVGWNRLGRLKGGGLAMHSMNALQLNYEREEKRRVGKISFKLD